METAKIDPRADIKNVTDLYNKGGDSYIHSVRESGEYFAAYQFQATSQEQQTNLAIDVSAKFAGGVVNLTFHDGVQNLIEEATASYSVQQGIFGLKGRPQLTGDEISQFVLNFAGQTFDELFITVLEIAPYSSVTGAPSGTENMNAWVQHCANSVAVYILTIYK